MSKSDLDRQIQQLKECKTLPEAEVKELCNQARDIFIEECNVQDVQAPVTVSSLIRVFNILFRFAGTSMANSMTLSNSSILEETAQRPTTSS